MIMEDLTCPAKLRVAHGRFDRGVLAVALNEDLGGAEDAGAGGHAVPHLVESLQSKRACHAPKIQP